MKIVNDLYKVDEETGVIIPEEKISKNWYRRPANYELGQFDKDIETNREKSLTIPDQSYTVREILEKFTRGLPLDIEKGGQYDSPEDFEDNFENAIDITDVEEKLSFIKSKKRIPVKEEAVPEPSPVKIEKNSEGNEKNN